MKITEWWHKPTHLPVPDDHPATVQRTATGYRMLLGGTVVEACMHPNAVTEQQVIPPATRYIRKICGPGMGMVRRVQTRGREYLVRRCPDCPTAAITTIGSDIYLPPGMIMYLEGDSPSAPDGESGQLAQALFDTPWDRR